MLKWRSLLLHDSGCDLWRAWISLVTAIYCRSDNLMGAAWPGPFSFCKECGLARLLDKPVIWEDSKWKSPFVYPYWSAFLWPRKPIHRHNLSKQMEDVPVAPLSGMRRWLFNAKNFVNIVPEKCKLLLYISINDSMLPSVCFFIWLGWGLRLGINNI